MPGVSELDSGQNVCNSTNEEQESKKGKAELNYVESNGDPPSPVTDSDENVNGSTGSNGTGSTSEEENAAGQDDGQEVVVIQDTGFTIKVCPAGLEPFDLPVSSMELVQEIYQVLTDKEDTCHRTCFSLQLDGQVLDNFAELKSIEGLTEGSVIKVVEEPYTAREARIHLRHIRDLLKSVDNQDAYNGTECSSLSFLNTVTCGNILDKKGSKPESVDCTPPDYIMPGHQGSDLPLLPLHPTNKDMVVPRCIKVLTYSGWNPPPPHRKMHGDLLYISVVTMEDKRYHLTASPKGFYVNQSTMDEFNPKPASQKFLCHSLVEVLNQLSPTFKRNFQTLLKKRSQKHPFERVATPYQIYNWLAPNMEHTTDYIRAEDAFSARLGHEEHIPGQTRDWNEELQTTRELSRKTLPDRLIRERAIFKVHSDFVMAATRGAMAVIDGNIMAINPGEEPKMQMFLWNNIFFSLGFDVKDHYKDFGGDYAAYVAPGNDLQGVKAYATVDSEGLFTLGTVLIDYRGYRVTAQSIIPGILEREQEQSVVYGSIDFGKTVLTHEKYRELLQKTSTTLKIRPHKVINEKGEEVELWSSVECKGIVGNDNRYYVLDLLRTFPPDANYLPIEGESLSEAAQALGFPRTHRHRLVTLRQELVDTFVETRYMAFVKSAAMQFQSLRLKKMQEEEKKKSQENGDHSKTTDEAASEETTATLENAIAKTSNGLEADEAQKLVDTLTSDNSTKEIVKMAAEAVGSLSENEFEIRFNPDMFQPHVKLADEESETYRKEKQLVKDAAEFLLVHQIPNFIKDCLEHTSSPIDGYTLTEALHHNGINMRYLGLVTQKIAKNPQLSYLHSICVAELVGRCVKHLFKAFMQGVELMSVSAAIALFLNCYLGTYPNPQTHTAMDELQSQRSNKRKRQKNKGTIAVQNTDNTEWASESPKSLWKKIRTEAREFYNFSIEGDSLDAACVNYDINKCALLRAFCKKCGVQILLRDYQFDSKARPTFTDEDIINVYPVVKHIQPKASDAYHVFTSGQNKIQQGLLRDGYELISEALNLLNNVYGAMHAEIAACCRLLARLNYIMGDYGEALVYQQRAVLMSERVLGIDHPNTITEYAHLALYCFANNQISTALRLMYHARYLALLCHGENHPEVALFDSNIGLILHAVGEFDLSLRYLDKALELNTRFHGEKSLKVAMNYHLVARTYSCKGDFRTAITKEKESFSIYKQLLGEGHDRTRESSEVLKHLTQQAVKFAKTMNQISKGEKVSALPPLQIQAPSMSSVLDTLNVINGIVFLHISQEDIEKFREEMVRRQQQQQGGATGAEGGEAAASVEPAAIEDKAAVGGKQQAAAAAAAAAADSGDR